MTEATTAAPAQTVATDTMPKAIRSALEHFFGEMSASYLGKCWSEATGENRAITMRDLLLRGLAYGIPAVGSRVTDPLPLAIDQRLVAGPLSDVFAKNPHACGVAASVFECYNEDSSLGDIRLGERSLSLYLAFASVSAQQLLPQIRSFIQKQSVAEEKTFFEAIVRELSHLMRDEGTRSITISIVRLLEALMVLKEKREEEHALTLDLGLPLVCSWDLVGTAAENAVDSLITEHKQDKEFEFLKTLHTYSTSQIVEELRDIGRFVGRGVCRLFLAESYDAKQKRFFVSDGMWLDHSNAPLARLYGLDWRVLSPSEPPDVRLVILPSSALSVVVQEDPLFDYFSGEWRYVDSSWKSERLGRAVRQDVDPKVIQEPVYRLLRFAYQMAYHHHGAILDVLVDSDDHKPDRLPGIRGRWNLSEVGETGAELPALKPQKEASFAEGLGRFAYSLAIQDGLTVWRITKDLGVQLVDFGYLEKADMEAVAKTWNEALQELGLEPSRLGGARHHAAFARSTRDKGKRLVLCVSQDGFVDAFVGKDSLRIR